MKQLTVFNGIYAVISVVNAFSPPKELLLNYGSSPFQYCELKCVNLTKEKLDDISVAIQPKRQKESFPTFSTGSLTAEQCLAQLSRANGAIRSVTDPSKPSFATSRVCEPDTGPSFDVRLCNRKPRAHIEISCYPLKDRSNKDEVQAVVWEVQRINNNHAIAFALDGLLDENLVPEIFEPVRREIVTLSLRGGYGNFLSSLPNLQLINLLHLKISLAELIVISEKDFTGSPRLRVLEFVDVSFRTIRPEAFLNILELQVFSYTFDVWTARGSNKARFHERNLHCDCDYYWLRKWLQDRPYLLSAKKEGEVYRIGTLMNKEFNSTFNGVDCALDVMNNQTTAKSFEFSVNDSCSDTEDKH